MSSLNAQSARYLHEIATNVFPGIVANDAQWDPIPTAKVFEGFAYFGARANGKNITPSRNIVIIYLGISESGIARFEGVGEHNLTR
jgi:hypothetical protein